MNTFQAADGFNQSVSRPLKDSSIQVLDTITNQWGTKYERYKTVHNPGRNNQITTINNRVIE